MIEKRSGWDQRERLRGWCDVEGKGKEIQGGRKKDRTIRNGSGIPKRKKKV
jgi:hypothetical protein